MIVKDTSSFELRDLSFVTFSPLEFSSQTASTSEEDEYPYLSRTTFSRLISWLASRVIVSRSDTAFWMILLFVAAAAVTFKSPALTTPVVLAPVLLAPVLTTLLISDSADDLWSINITYPLISNWDGVSIFVIIPASFKAWRWFA